MKRGMEEKLIEATLETGKVEACQHCANVCISLLSDFGVVACDAQKRMLCIE